MKHSKLMRAIIFRDYGNPQKVLKLVKNRKIPIPNKNEVLVKVECASVNAADRHIVRANYLIIRLIFGLFRPSKNKRILGMDIAGTILSIGRNVKGFQVGDAVVADIRKSYGGGYAEYATVHKKYLVKKTEGVSFEQACTVPISGQAAMMGMILYSINLGNKVLVNGASGGVGSFGIQIAKAQGAYVTAICSTQKIEVVKSWGADEIIDYKKKDSIKALIGKEFDAVFDTASFECPGRYKQILKKSGRYVLVGGDFYNMLKVKSLGRFDRGSQKFMALTQKVEVTKNIKTVLEMIADKKIKPAIQKVISLKDVPDALHSLEQRTVVGKIVVDLNKEV
ncbi:NAD(P)-dependent alcohol dehydrogenase [Aquimarina sp. ERC-38]|uniref:NAD(P)-dependent alcohol dehydrogenase n=1 Tax=Aquimarina sp. ERC-38 TaxID=2949996 RepID=UPI0022462949|nr:NAD(P)-dependent alcohol dehydrogenase [Aquimarina sp. ERC-38]UZO80378.1 NAD(P)-dependent alcohol dehydrogenase [Aquimarina sp. ERC-38]